MYFPIREYFNCLCCFPYLCNSWMDVCFFLFLFSLSSLFHFEINSRLFHWFLPTFLLAIRCIFHIMAFYLFISIFLSWWFLSILMFHVKHFAHVFPDHPDSMNFALKHVSRETIHSTMITWKHFYCFRRYSNG